MFDKNFILHGKSAFTPKSCEVAINYFEKRVDLQTTGQVGGQIDFDRKKCTEIYLKRKEYTLFENTLQKYLKEYIKEYPFINNLHFLSTENRNDTRWCIKRFASSGFMILNY